jgi:membrane protein
MQARRFVRSLSRNILADNITNISAAMAYWAVMALFPMLLFVVSIAMLVMPRAWIEHGTTTVLEAVPGEVRAQLGSRIAAFTKQPHGWFALLGVVLALWSTRGGLLSLTTALGSIFHKHDRRSWMRRQLVALAVAAVITLLAIAAFALLVLGPIAGHWLVDRWGLGDSFEAGWAVARWILAALLVMLAWALLYRFLPDTDAPLRVFTPGAICGVILWIVASRAFGAYLSHFGHYEATYGALGGAIVFLTWLWLSNLALLLGAEIDLAVAEIRAPYDEGAARLARTPDDRAPAHS